MKEGKLLFQKQSDDTFQVILFRKTDKGQSILKGFQNAESWQHLHNEDCEYIKYSKKQIEVYVKEFGKKPLYNSIKTADTPVYNKKPEAIIKKTEVERPTERRKTSNNENKNPLTGRNLFFENNSIKYTQLPSDTRESLNLKEIDNNSLLINKLVHFYEFDKSTVKLDNVNKNKSESEPEPVLFRNNISKKKWHYELPINFETPNNLKVIKSVNNRQKKLKEELDLISITFKPNWRLIIGLGGASVYETSMTLHHIYGFPYIPASAVKGVLRSWVIQNVFENNEKDALNSESDNSKNFCKIFGCPKDSILEKEHQGKVTFFDAFPTKAPTIKADVMTVHYDKWYSEGKAPTDTMSPNPIPFLTVENTPFQFLFGSKDFDITQKLWAFEENGEKKTLSEWLKDALENHGIGAKTAVGYGYMSE
jgi:CRISPR type III-B/RAMP module RAMP protein Cmr6